MAKVKEPLFSIVYQGKDITADLGDSLISVSYTDKTEDESDEITIKVEDTGRLWQNSWSPQKGDKLIFTFGYKGQQVGSGEFEVDETTMDGPPDVVQIKATATAGVSSELRTKKSKSYEAATVKKIVEEIATTHSFTVIGEIPDISIARETQNRETDLGFLKRLGKKYGFLFSPKGDRLVFTNRKQIDSADFVVSIDRTELSKYNFTEKSAETYSKAKVSYSNPDTAEVVESEVNYEGDETVNSDTLEIYDRCEDENQAKEVATSKLHEANSRACEMSIGGEGNPLVLSGSNMELTGFGIYTGVYNITESTHTANKGGGYSMTAKGKRVVKITDASKQTPKVELETLDI